MVTALGRYPRLTYFGLGCVVTTVVFLALSHLHEAAEFLYGVDGRSFMSWPAWLKATDKALSYLPWIALALALAARLYLGRAIRLFSFAGGLAAPYLAVMMVLFMGPVAADYWHRKTFDAPAWRAATDDRWSEWPVRLTMADDLLRSGVLRAKSQEDIVSLLGKPDPSRGWEKWDMVYFLGPQRGFLRIDGEWLVIKLGSDGTAQEIAIIAD